ncbi:integrase catalytic domain-containing protein [Trichonephila clavata]|uniref:Integrase catalytic domain-containing protein n=1 Tax=Trichonephila clavata TaxID=2740835 RepID=A0A8X6KAJ9_TRICU|nr:integrase catalytic domain-containing protein [Trichonephila clavata]
MGIAKNVQTVDDTYDSLFLALEQRFENKRLIISKHINAVLMLKYEKFRADSNVDLRNLVDTCTKHLRALKLSKYILRIVADIISYAGFGYRDKVSYREMTLESTDISKWDDFLAFLHKRCLFLENLPPLGTKGKQNFRLSTSQKLHVACRCKC